MSTDTTQTVRSNPPQTARIYVPRYRSGGYAIVIAMTKHMPEAGFMSKHEIIEAGQPYCDSSFTAPNVNVSISRTAWNSMATLISKGLVYRFGFPHRFMLTEEGRELGLRLVSLAEANVVVGSSASQADLDCVTSSGGGAIDDLGGPEHDDLMNIDRLVTLPANTYDIYLVLDSREVVRSNRNYFRDELLSRGVKILTRSLALGDFLWLAKRRGTEAFVQPDSEIVLDCIIERKLMDDLVSSIKDERYREQKFRLSGCGLTNVTYLVEEGSLSNAEGFGKDRLVSAMTQTQILDGFFLKRTFSPQETVQYLFNMTRVVQSMYAVSSRPWLLAEATPSRAVSNTDEAGGNLLHCTFFREQNQTIYALRARDTDRNTVAGTRQTLAAALRISPTNVVVTYGAFVEMNSKTGGLTLSDVWMRQLMCIRGVSAEKAASVAAHFPTMSSFVLALARAGTTQQKEALLRSLGDGRKGIGPTLAREIVAFFDQGQD
ncbi:Crossover junction endonuclease mus81 [Polyrhizophydium stewartii]|uniref:Crossover junction endonuclease MUS81 n=1 Tax=Polyrhizophydium stewartii TaxID=2732419 RepID=A0ABR4MWB7_9FUNG